MIKNPPKGYKIYKVKFKYEAPSLSRKIYSEMKLVQAKSIDGAKHYIRGIYKSCFAFDVTVYRKHIGD